MDFKNAIKNYAEQPIPKQVVMDLLKDYKRPYDKIIELIPIEEKNELLPPPIDTGSIDEQLKNV